MAGVSGTSTLDTFKTRDVRSRAEAAAGLDEAEVADLPKGMAVQTQKNDARRKNHQPSHSTSLDVSFTAAGGGNDEGVPVEEAGGIADGPDTKHPCDHLRRYRTFGWAPSLTLSDDENYMDLAAVVAKNATCCGTSTCGDREDGRRNQVSCVLVNPALLQRNTWALNSDEGIYDDSSEGGRKKYLGRRLYGAVIGVSTDIAMFRGVTDGNDGMVHAEMCALGEANRRGEFTEGCTAYVTAPPCINCFGALIVSGAKRIVSVGRSCEMHRMGLVATEREVEMVDLGLDLSAAADIRMAALVRAWDEGAEERAAERLAQRQRKKEEGEARKARHDKKKRKRREEKMRHEEQNTAEFLG